MEFTLAAQTLLEKVQEAAQQQDQTVTPEQVLASMMVMGMLAASAAFWLWALMEFVPKRQMPIPFNWETDLQPPRNVLVMTLTFLLVALSVGAIAWVMLEEAKPKKPPHKTDLEILAEEVEPGKEQSDAAPPRLTVYDFQAMVAERLGLSVVLLCCLLLVPRKHSFKDFGLDLRHWKKDFLYGGMGFLFAFPLVMALQIILALTGIGTEENQHQIFQVLRDDPSSVSLIIWISISAIIVAPIAEELLFRVLLQGWLERKVAPFLAIVTTAVIFSFVHGWPLMISLLPLALILGYIYHRQGRYLSVVVMHVLFNCFNMAVGLLSLSGGQPPLPEGP